jgi:hypothetical protein
MKSTGREITHRDLSTLTNICFVAAERFAEHAAHLRQLAKQPTPPEGTLHPTGDAARRLAEQFEKQEAEARAYAALFSEAEPFILRVEAEEEEPV